MFFNIFLMLMGFILICLIVKNFERIGSKGFVFLIPIYTFVLFFTKIYNYHFSTFFMVIISIIMLVSSCVSSIVGIFALGFSETMEKKTPKVIKRQKLGEGFGISLLLTSLIILIKTIVDLYKILINFILEKPNSALWVLMIGFFFIFFFTCGQEKDGESCDANP